MKLKILISSNDIQNLNIQEYTSALSMQLENFDTLEIKEAKNPNSSKGAKGDPLTIGVIVFTLSSIILKSVLTYLDKSNNIIKIEAPNGAKVEFMPNKSFSKNEIIELVKELTEIN